MIEPGCRAPYNSCMQEWSIYRHHAELEIDLLHAHFSRHSYPLHSHDYYVIALVEAGTQYFRFGRQRHLTPAGGFILLNPGESHTGEPGSRGGYRYRAIYPTLAHMRGIAHELGMPAELPLFATPRGNHTRLIGEFTRMHKLLMANRSGLEAQTALNTVLAKMLAAFGEVREPAGKPASVRKALELIDAQYARTISLDELAQAAALSRFHFLRSFRDQVGMPPHAYIENRRVAVAQQLIASGMPLAQVAVEVGFSSQSHFTQRFRQTLGVTPGRYGQLLK